MQNNRRQWIRLNGGLLVSAGMVSAWPGLFAQENPGSAAAKDIILRTTDPRNGEPAVDKLVANWMTPTRLFYVRSHAPNPKIDPLQFRLKIDGMVGQSKEFTLAELGKFQRHETTATMTCAGNRRAEYNEEGKVGGVQWGPAAIGNATWAGVSLADVLKQCEVLPGAKHICFEGLDEIERKDGIIPFGGSIPISRAMDINGSATVLLADQMNGQALTPDHGYPLRTVVPGYIGARSVKWLGKITVSDRPSDNHYVATAYKIVKKTDPIDWAESGPIYRYPINAAIGSLEALPDGKTKIVGYALPSGRAGSHIKAVRVSKDGKTWVKAKLESEPQDFCWTLWTATLNIESTVKSLYVRAEDTAGDFMPYRVPWNAKGYLQNSWYEHSLEG